MPLEIADLQLYPLREPASGRTYSVLRVRTRDGLTGWGECAAATPQQLAEIAPFWTGKAATSYAQVQPGSALAGALDMALLDIVGKAGKAPIYRVLGGPTRNKARVFTSAPAENAAASGHRAFGIRLPAPAARNQGQTYSQAVRRLVDEVRAAGGDFVLEGAGTLTPADAGRLAAEIEHLHPLWFDEPCALTSLEALHKIADESVLPVGYGRDVEVPATFQNLLRESLIDVVRPDIARFGISGVRRIAALAETYYVAVAPNHDGGPIATAAALQLAASLPNFFIQHVPLPASEADRAMRAEIAGGIESVKDGFCALPTAAGLGIAVNEAALEKYHAS